MEKTELKRLKTEIRTELSTAERTVAEVEEIVRGGVKELPQKYMLYSLSLLLHNFYCSVENIFLRISPVLNGGKPEGGDFHRRLLQNMSNEIEGVRPAVISKETHKLLIEFMKFRHIVRHMYAFDLEMEKVEALARKTRTAFDSLKKDIAAFNKFIDVLSESI